MKLGKNRTSLVLMELIITLLFFSVVSAVCARMFLAAHLMSTENKELSEAINACQSMAELLISGESEYVDPTSLCPDLVENSGGYLLNLEDNRSISVSIDIEGNMELITVSYLNDNGSTVYKINTQKYIGGNEFGKE